jgi:NADPH2:quinone reductase
VKAITYDRTGPAREVLRLGDIPTPAPGPGEVRVKLAYSGVNPSDVKSRSGSRSKTLPFPLIVPHSDGSGTIDAVGAGVPASRVGQRVFTFNAAWGRPFGTAAEFVTLPSELAVRLPDQVEDLAIGACLGIPAMTAYHALATDGGVHGKTVLVAGGAGAVGHYAIQLARILGARRIFTTVSSAEKAAIAGAAGADVVLDYKTEDVAARVLEETGGQGIDRVVEVDFGTNVGLDHKIVRRDGQIVVYGSNALEIAVPFVPMILKNVLLRFFIVYNLSPPDRERALVHLGSLLAMGKLEHNIAARLPLAEAAAAHELVETGCAVGNVVLEIA